MTESDFDLDQRGRKKIVHGTRAGYTVGGCRCEKCKQAGREYYISNLKKKRPPAST